MDTHTLDRILRLDAAANALAGTALVATGTWLAAPLGLGSSWPIRVVGLALIVYAIENLMVARRGSRTGLMSLIAVDLAFAAAVLVAAIADPTSAETWMRWVLVAVAELSATFGVLKAVALRAGSPATS